MVYNPLKIAHVALQSVNALVLKVYVDMHVDAFVMTVEW